MFIYQKYKELVESLPSQVELVAVSKTKPVAEIQKAYEAGQRVFGENKVQEMVNKHEALPKDIQWHMIGHVQRNKIKYMGGFVSLIHGVDKWSTLVEIDKQGRKHDRVINCLLQVKIASEDSKFGLAVEEVEGLLAAEELTDLTNLRVVGLMGMASFTEDNAQIEKEFAVLKSLYDDLKQKGFALDTLSMGMSGDYPLAIKKGSTMIRVGSAIFGARNYIAGP